MNSAHALHRPKLRQVGPPNGTLVEAKTPVWHGANPYDEVPLTHVKNSPPPASRLSLCRRCRRSGVLLVLIGIGCLVCCLSTVHLSWYSMHLPTPDHAPSVAASDDGQAPTHLAAPAQLKDLSLLKGATPAKAAKGGNRSKETKGEHRLPGDERVKKDRSKTGKIRQDDKRQSEKLQQSLPQRLAEQQPTKDKQAPHPVAPLKGEQRLPGEERLNKNRTETVKIQGDKIHSQKLKQSLPQQLVGPQTTKDKQTPHPVAHLKGEQRLPGEEMLNKNRAKIGNIQQGDKRQSEKLQLNHPQQFVGQQPTNDKQAPHPVAPLKGEHRSPGEEVLNKNGAKTINIQQGDKRQSEQLRLNHPQGLLGPQPTKDKQAPPLVAHLKVEHRLPGEERLNNNDAKTVNIQQGDKR